MAEQRRGYRPVAEVESQTFSEERKPKRKISIGRVFLGIFLCLFGFTLCNFWWTHSSSPLVERVVGGSSNHQGVLGKVAFVFIAHDRPEYFRESLKSVFAARQLSQVDIIVSMDFPETFPVLESVVEEFASEAHPIRIWHNVMTGGYLFFQTSDDRITYHHKQIFNRVFADYDYAILLESDLVVSPDFLEYLFSVGHLVNGSSPSLFCASGWNDNGMKHFYLDESRLFRTDFFPGLGWMMHRSMWTDILINEWPGRVGNYAYDIWLREGASTRTRDCIVPEVSRTHHISKYGAHVNGNGHHWYDAMVLASGNIPIDPGEVDVVATVEAFEARVKSEAIIPSRTVPFTNPFKMPYSKSVLVVVEKDVSWIRKVLFGTPTNYFKDVNEVFGLFSHQMRSSHKGLNRITLHDPMHGKTNVTLIAEHMLSYWGVEV